MTLSEGRSITARRVPQWVEILLSLAKCEDSWLDLMIEGAKSRGISIPYKSPRRGRPQIISDAKFERLCQMNDAVSKLKDLGVCLTRRQANDALIQLDKTTARLKASVNPSQRAWVESTRDGILELIVRLVEPDEGARAIAVDAERRKIIEAAEAYADFVLHTNWSLRDETFRNMFPEPPKGDGSEANRLALDQFLSWSRYTERLGAPVVKDFWEETRKLLYDRPVRIIKHGEKKVLKNGVIEE